MYIYSPIAFPARRHGSVFVGLREVIMHFSRSLKLNHVFRKLYNRGDSAVNRYLVLYCQPNHLQENRVGITVGKKLGKAVVRNRARRRLREVYRLNESRFRPGYDIVVVARSRAVTADFGALQSAYLGAAKRLGILVGKDEEG